MLRVARPGTRIVLTGPTVANNRELYRLHELGGSPVRTTMGREVFQSAVDAYFARNEVRMKFTEYLNVVRFPSLRDDFIGNYAVTKLFLDNVAPAERDTVLSRLRERALAIGPCPAERDQDRRSVRRMDLIPDGARVLCFSPHPDDTEFGVGATLSKYRGRFAARVVVLSVPQPDAQRAAQRRRPDESGGDARPSARRGALRR